MTEMLDLIYNKAELSSRQPHCFGVKAHQQYNLLHCINMVYLQESHLVFLREWGLCFVSNIQGIK